PSSPFQGECPVANEKHLLVALNVLTEGSGAEVPEAVQAKALTAQRAARPWTTGKGIQGLGIGEKITDGEKLSELVLKVYVDKKKPRSRVKNRVPQKVAVPGLPTEVPTDVEEIGVVAVEPNTTRVRPALPGFSVG